MLKFVIILLALKLQLFHCSRNVDLLMPGVAPIMKDTYLCHKFKMDDTNPIFITEFEPKATKETAHHILLFGCEIADSEETWNCGEMLGNGNSQYKQGPVCKGGKQSIIYAWAMDAPKLILPEDVAFKVGGKTAVKYLVLQVHYSNVERFLNGDEDHSGISLTVQDKPLNNVAGVYLLETSGHIRKNSEDYFETACEMNEDLIMHPFAYRTHAHKLGKVNSGYLIKNNSKEWIEIGRRSPQLPQMFYPATNDVTVKKGDVLTARCTMKNNLDHDVYIGSTGEDEMCNFYIMYYVKGDTILENNICMSMGPPTWYFKNFKLSNGKQLDLSNIPSDISEVPIEQINELKKESHMNHMNKIIENREIKYTKETDQLDESEYLESIAREYILTKLLKSLSRKQNY